MKLQMGGFLALTIFAFLAKAGHVHVDVSDNGDVAVDIDTTPQRSSSSARVRPAMPEKPIYPSRQHAHIIADDEVDLGYEIHKGFLSVSQGPLQIH